MTQSPWFPMLPREKLNLSLIQNLMAVSLSCDPLAGPSTLLATKHIPAISQGAPIPLTDPLATRD